jgi:hypothetical protein
MRSLPYADHSVRLSLDLCPENNRRDAKAAEKYRRNLCALCAFAVAFICGGAPSGMGVFPEDGPMIIRGATMTDAPALAQIRVDMERAAYCGQSSDVGLFKRTPTAQ